MKMVLDTNIYRENPRMDKVLFERLIKYGERTRATFMVPKVVAEELTSVHRRHVQETAVALKSAIRKANAALVTSAPVTCPEVDVEEEATKYLGYVLAKLGIEATDIVPYKPEFLDEVVRRAVNRIRPCSDSGEEFRDALLWLTCLEIAKEDLAVPTVLISKNTKQFAADGSLHPDLLGDVTTAGVNLQYYQTIDAFLAVHAEKIKFITAEWVEDQIVVEMIEDSVNEWAQYGLEELRDFFNAHGMRYKRSPGSIFVAHMAMENFFVEPREGENEFLVDVIYKGRIEVELEPQYLVHQYVDDYYVMAPETETYEVPFEAVIELFVSDGNVVDMHDYFRFDQDVARSST